ncbi:MAG: hypothetical protein ACI84K_001257 [Pseudohongiellaceae bacterium]|jgi:hypothetical protein
MANNYLTLDERKKLLKLKVQVMRRAGLTTESVERNAEISRRNLMISDCERKDSNYRENLIKEIEEYERSKQLQGKPRWLKFFRAEIAKCDINLS